MKQRLMGIAMVAAVAGCGGKMPPSAEHIKAAEEAIQKSKTQLVMQYAPEYIKKAEASLQEAKDIVAAKDETRYEMAQLLIGKAHVYPELAEKIAEMRDLQSKVESTAADAKAAAARAKAEVQTVVAALKRTRSVLPHLRGELEKLIGELDAIMKEFAEIDKKYPSSSPPPAKPSS